MLEETSLDTQRHLRSSTGKRQKRGGTVVGKQRSSLEDTYEEEDFFKSLAPSKVPKFVELLKFKSVCRGLKVLGVVTEVLATEVRVSLPHGLRGRVLLENAGVRSGNGGSRGHHGHLDGWFTPGQVVRCRVVADAMRAEGAEGQGGSTGKGKQRRNALVELSVDLEYVHDGLRKDAVFEGACLTGSVQSVEDHGYVLGFGVKGASGFLAKKDIGLGCGVDVGLKKVGSLVDVKVVSVVSVGGRGQERRAVVTGVDAVVDGGGYERVVAGDVGECECAECVVGWGVVGVVSDVLYGDGGPVSSPAGVGGRGLQGRSEAESKGVVLRSGAEAGGVEHVAACVGVGGGEVAGCGGGV